MLVVLVVLSVVRVMAGGGLLVCRVCRLMRGLRFCTMVPVRVMIRGADWQLCMSLICAVWGRCVVNLARNDVCVFVKARTARVGLLMM